MIALWLQACAPVDVNNPVTVKNNNELLRCFAVVSEYNIQPIVIMTVLYCYVPPPPPSSAKSHSNRVVAFLLQKLEVNQEKVRVATLNVIKHLINSCDSELDDKKPLLISGLNIIILENNLRVNLNEAALECANTDMPLSIAGPTCV